MSVTFHPSTAEPRSRPAARCPPSLQQTAALSVTAPASPVLVPRLDSLTLSSIAAHLSTHPNIDRVPAHYLPSLLPLLALYPPVDLCTAAVYIESDVYWRWRAQADFAAVDPVKHGGRWKRAYAERWLQRRLEGLKEEEEEGEEAVQRLQKEVRVLSPWIHTLQLEQLPSHADLSFLLRSCDRLSAVQARYGAVRLHMDYDPLLLGARLDDTQSLARLLLHAPSLFALSLPCNLLDDRLYPALHPGLAASHSLTHLDLSHNALGDASAALIAALLPTSLLTHLDLSDNLITAPGAAALSSALAARTGRGGPLELRLGMNRVGWEGMEGLLREAEGGGVGVLEVVGCGVGVEGRPGVVRAVRGRGGKGLRELYVACNPLVGAAVKGRGEEEKEAEDAGEDLLAAVALNKALVTLDIALCGWSDAVQQRVQEVLNARIDAEKASRRRALEGKR